MGVGLVNFFLIVAMCGLGWSCDDEDGPELVQMHGKYSDKCFVVSRQDVERVRKHKWRIWGRYPHSTSAGSLHHFIIGERPSNVPEDWVVDHANGDRMDARRTNLRWTSVRFNTWNKEQKLSSSTYRGVSQYGDKWYAKSLRVSIGAFETEQGAGIACAKHAIKEFGEWAMTSHVLLANFTPSEIACMKAEVDAGDYVTRTQKALPKGVTYHKKERKYYVRCDGVTVGTFVDREEAIRVSEEYRKEKRMREWEAYKRLEITRDPKDNAAVIALSGPNGKGHFAKVPDEFWHILTFKVSWCLTSKGYSSGWWKGKTWYMHGAVWSLLNPDYKAEKGFSIDHRNPSLTLDNRAHNLRLASKGDQERNKRNRGATSKYPGVYRKSKSTFGGNLVIDYEVHRVTPRKTEVEAAMALNALRVELLGPDTPLTEIVE
jgi:HNH endonuclease